MTYDLTADTVGSGLSRVENRLVKIYSHVRSGTHYLAHLLARNFYEGVDLSTGAGAWGHWKDRQPGEGSRVGKLFGHHSEPPPTSLPGIYLIRDGRDVAVSLWRTRHFLSPEMHDISFSEFLRTHLDWVWTPSAKSGPKWSIVKNWYEHVRRWIAAGDDHPEILILFYEALVLNSDVGMAVVENKLGLKPCHEEFKVVHNLVGIAPNEGRRGLWKTHFSSSDREYFRSIVPDAFMERLGYIDAKL